MNIKSNAKRINDKTKKNKYFFIMMLKNKYKAA